MAKLNLQSATARRSLVIRLVDDALIHSQSDLVRELGKLGYVVTQATASRPPTCSLTTATGSNQN